MLKYNNMRYFISDLHFFHKLVHWKYRNHNATLSDMNEEIITTWNKRVRKLDIVYVLGDVTFGKVDETKDLIRRMNGRKILIRGNHDERFTSKQWIEMGFQDVRDTCVIKKDNERWILSHFPYSSAFKFFFYKWTRPRNEASYYKLYLPYKGYKLLHGHHHDGLPYKHNQVNVAWDVNKALLDENQIKTRFETNALKGFKRLLADLKLTFF